VETRQGHAHEEAGDEERGTLVGSGDRLQAASLRDVAAALRDYVEHGAGASHAAQRHAKPLTICFTLDDGDLYDAILRDRARGGQSRRGGAISRMRFGAFAVGAVASAAIAMRLLEIAA
jgi:hypothetical protein